MVLYDNRTRQDTQMKLHYEIEDNGQDKVVIFFGWQGSTPRYRSKYLQLWKELGYNCIGTGMRFDHMFLPPSLRKSTTELFWFLGKQTDKVRL
jgi:hypothetical protein